MESDCTSTQQAFCICRLVSECGGCWILHSRPPWQGGRADLLLLPGGGELLGHALRFRRVRFVRRLDCTHLG